MQLLEQNSIPSWSGQELSMFESYSESMELHQE